MLGAYAISPDAVRECVEKVVETGIGSLEEKATVYLIAALTDRLEVLITQLDTIGTEISRVVDTIRNNPRTTL